MAIRARIYVDFDWVPDGAGMATLGQNQANNPGYAANLQVGAVGNAQTLRVQVSEPVPGGDTPTLANLLTALTNAANDIAGTPTFGTTPILSQAGGYAGGPLTPFAIISGWSTGNP